jgi:ribosomal protein S18 acetylase RimI-like enzyme
MIEVARKEDGPAVLAISAAVRVFSPEEVECVRELWEEYLKQGPEGDYRFIVYRDGGQVLGYGVYGHKALSEGTWDFYFMGVEPTAHSRGIGRSLLKRVEAEAAAHGGFLVLIETSMTPGYAAARHLYESAGYKREAVIRDYYARGDDMVLYSRYVDEQSA